MIIAHHYDSLGWMFFFFLYLHNNHQSKSVCFATCQVQIKEREEALFYVNPAAHHI